MTSDSELVSSCLKGNPLAQKQFFDRFARQMLGVCYRYVQNINEAEDVLQDGFVKAFKYMKNFRNEGSLEGWLRRIMVTTALNHLKKERHIRVEQEITSSINELSSDTDALQRMENEEVIKMIQGLSTGYRTILNLYAIEGYSHKEIGEMLNISESTSRSQYTRAKQLLKQRIGDFFSYGLTHEGKAR